MYAQNCLIQFPSRRWGFVGQVDARLCKPNGEQLAWNTKEEALAAAEAISAKVEYVQGGAK